MATNNINYLSLTLSKEVKDLYDKNFKSLKKEIWENIRRWKDHPCSWISGINKVKMAIFPKVIYRFNAVPYQNLNTSQFFTDIERTIFLKQKKKERTIVRFIWKNKISKIAKTIMDNNKTFRRYHHPWFQALLQCYSNKNGMTLA